MNNYTTTSFLAHTLFSIFTAIWFCSNNLSNWSSTVTNINSRRHFGLDHSHSITAQNRMMLIGLTCFISSLFLTVTGECGGDVRWRDPEALSVMMNSTETRCADINLTTQRRVCKVLSEDDEKKLLCGENGQDVDCNRPISLCPDGSLNKTCFPVSDSNSIHYMCLCHSAGDQCTFTANKPQWSPWQTLTGHKKGFGFTRKLHMESSSECLVEYDSQIVVNIISEYLPNNIFSASSTFSSTSSVPYRATRIDQLLGQLVIKVTQSGYKSSCYNPTLLGGSWSGDDVMCFSSIQEPAL